MKSKKNRVRKVNKNGKVFLWDKVVSFTIWAEKNHIPAMLIKFLLTLVQWLWFK